MSKLRKSLVKLLDEIGEASGCHRMPERSFFFRGHQFPVCARCTGVCIGQFTAVFFALFKKFIPLSLSVSMLFVMGADWGIQEAGFKESNNRRRLVTGFLGGLGLFSIYIDLLRRLFKRIRQSF